MNRDRETFGSLGGRKDPMVETPSFEIYSTTICMSATTIKAYMRYVLLTLIDMKYNASEAFCWACFTVYRQSPR